MIRLLFLLPILYCAPVLAQQMKFYDPFPNADSTGSYNLIGAVGNSIITLETQQNGQPQLIYTDTVNKTVFRKTLDFIQRANISSFSVIPLQENLLVITQSTEGNKAYVNLVTLNDLGKLIEPIKTIDSSRTDLLGEEAYLNVMTSADNQYLLLYRVIAGLKADHLLINYMLIRLNDFESYTKKYYIPFNYDLQQPTGFFIEPDGSVSVGVYDNDDNYRLGSTVNIYRTNLSEENPTLSTVYLKEKKPLRIFFVRNPQNGRVILASLFRNFYSKNVEGTMAILMNNDNSVDTVIYQSFHQDFRKGISDGLPGIKPADMVNQMELRQLVFHKDQRISFLADVLAPKKAVNRGRGEQFRNIESHNSNQESDRYSQSQNASQVFDDIRNQTANINIPKVSTGNQEVDRITNQQIEKMNLASAERRGNDMVEGKMPGRSYEAAAYKPSPKKINASAMVYKSIVLTADSTGSALKSTITQHLYLPGSPLSAIVPMISASRISLYSYELNKEKIPALTVQSVSFTDNKVVRSVLPDKGNFVFFQNNAMEINGKLITLYTNDKGEIGIAEIVE